MARRSKDGAAGTETRQRILDAASAMFAEHGVEGVSLRELTTRAEVNLAAVHYHFGSKEAVLAEVFSRSARKIADWRLELLSKVGRHEDGRPYLEDVLDAFLRPALGSSRRQNRSFVRLRARLALERDEAIRRILGDAFDESSRATIEALAEALPGLPRQELFWRFHFLIGSMFYTMADPGRIQALSKGECNPTDADEALERMVATFAHVFRQAVDENAGRAPAPKAAVGD